MRGLDSSAAAYQDRSAWVAYVALVAPGVVVAFAAWRAAIRPIAAIGLMVYVWVATAIWFGALFILFLLIIATWAGITGTPCCG
jgi:hypothetical protein